MIPFQYLALRTTDSVTATAITLDLTSGVQFALVRYAPQVAPQRASVYAEQSPYADVDEEIVIDVLGDTAARCLANLAALQRMLDQSVRWADYANVNVVQLLALPMGSATTTPYRAVVIGQRAQSGIVPTPQQDVSTGRWVLRDITLQIRRGGWWLHATESATSSSIAIPGPYDLTTLADHPTLSPTRLTFAGLPVGTNNLFPDFGFPAYLVLTNRSLNVSLQAASGLADGVRWTSVADAANLPFNAQILRYTPSVADTWEAIANGNGLTVGGVRQVAVFVTARANAAVVGAASFYVRAVLIERSPAAITPLATYGDPVLIDNSLDNAARPVFLGLFSAADGSANAYRITLEARAASISGSPTLDFDIIAPIRIIPDSPTGTTNAPGTIQVFRIPPNRPLVSAIFPAGTANLDIDPRADTHITPVASIRNASSSVIAPFITEGASVPLSASPNLYATLFACGNVDNTAPSRWRYANAAGTAVVSLTMTAARIRSYIALE